MGAAPDAVGEYRAAVTALDEAAPVTPAVRELARHLRLSRFECAVLMLCAAVEVDPELAAALPTADRRPSLALALSLFSGADWGAISPGAPLLRHRIVVPLASGE